jgi:hypothetical protein
MAPAICLVVHACHLLVVQLGSGSLDLQQRGWLARSDAEAVVKMQQLSA